MLRSLRTEHGVPVKELRRALSYAEKSLGIDRLLLRPELRDRRRQGVSGSLRRTDRAYGIRQLAMRRLFDEHLKRIEWDSSRFPIRLYPFLSASASSAERPIVIDPRIAFGRPVVASKGIATLTIAERIDAGESVNDIAADYDLEQSEIEEAVVYERAA